ncbi:HEAT repeat domain-containing protein [Aquincola tertiaricarbonis]|uniref:HEAT repeat domain-containing protein n=1 Tax=Aquincola tertiaricarbonis TaxID=391953 RepID=A0ABY4SK62_AQUTE|nr:HEAT repeat domain-containing protein [Aquincola tertiaricarbonis]URI11549.1 HEAT repeat domain-containing protein [Aquincola tertiaricarbonis]
MGLKKPATHEPLRHVVQREYPRDLGGLMAQLREGDVDQRRWAARDLAGHAQAAPLLGERLLDEPSPRVREAILHTLAGMPGDAAVAALLPLLRSDDAQLRNGAIAALATMPALVGPRIGALLQDEDSDVRIFTVNMLAELKHERTVHWLLQVLQHDAAVNVVAAAIEVLAEVGGPEHADALRAAARRFSGDPFIAFATDMALQRVEAH